MTKIILTMSIHPEQLARLQARCDVLQLGWGKTGVRLNKTEMADALKDADILLVGYEQIDSEIIIHSPGLKLIGCARSNPVNVDINAATQQNIPVLYTPARNAIATAEYTMGIMLSESRNIAKAYHSLKNGDYLGDAVQTFDHPDLKPDVIWELDGESPYKKFRGVELCDHVIGLIGIGSIGSRVARLAQAFGMKVVAYSLSNDADKARSLGIELIPLDDLLRISDYISIHCRVTPQTIGLIGQREFSLMKPSAYLINTARAVVVDQQALLDALQAHRIAGAALDVFWYEPLPKNHPLLQLDNVTFTPHLAGASFEVIERHSRMIVDDVLSWLDGKPIKHVYNPIVFSANHSPFKNI